MTTVNYKAQNEIHQVMTISLMRGEELALSESEINELNADLEAMLKLAKAAREKMQVAKDRFRSK